jgi:hypothetical protein
LNNWAAVISGEPSILTQPLQLSTIANAFSRDQYASGFLDDTWRKMQLKSTLSANRRRSKDAPPIVGLSTALTRMAVSTALGMTLAMHHPDFFGDLFFLFPDFVGGALLRSRVQATHARKEPLQASPRPFSCR